MRTEYEENREFEAEVRRVAEAVWGLAPGECQPEHYSNVTPRPSPSSIGREVPAS